MSIHSGAARRLKWSFETIQRRADQLQVQKCAPPNIARICEVFPKAAESGVIFAWGFTPCYPAGHTLPPELRVHEAVHSLQQIGEDSPWYDPQAGEVLILEWWNRYLTEPDFMLEQETEAHIAEYKRYCQDHLGQTARDKYVREIAARMHGPLYNGASHWGGAMKVIKQGAKALQ